MRTTLSFCLLLLPSLPLACTDSTQAGGGTDDASSGTGSDASSTSPDAATAGSSGETTTGSSSAPDSTGSNPSGSDTSDSEGDTEAGPTTCQSPYPPDAIIASTVAPGYDAQNASEAFINALTSAEAGDTVVVDFVPGTEGVWNIEEMYPSWFDGDSGEHQVADDVTVFFEPGVTLRAMSETYDDPSGLGMLFRLENVSGWTIAGYGAKFEFDQSGLGDGEYRHSIALYDCANIHIEGLLVEGSGGDGLSVSTRSETGYSENISIENLRLVGHRRQAATLVSVDGFTSRNVLFAGTSNRPPNSGVDLEPNYDEQRLTGIHFVNSQMRDNDYTGLLFAFAHQSGPSEDFDITFDDTFIHDNWQAKGDEVNGYSRAAIVMGNAGGATEQSANQGQITFNRLYIRDEEYSGLFTVKHGHSFHVAFNDWVIANVGNSNVAQDRYPIFTNRYDYGSSNPPAGRLALDGLLVIEDRDVPFFRLAGSSSDDWSIDDLLIANARIATPYTGEGIDNVQNRPEGAGTSIDYTQAASLPETTVALSSSVSEIARGTAAELTVTRSGRDLAYPLAVEYTVSGTATNFDDFDGLHGFVVIPANESSASIVLSARDKCDERESVTVTLAGADAYELAGETAASVELRASQLP